ncbi:hypothetical protein J2S56_000808 [Corynebacterium lowii]|nr:hypothetical protein [Corynebacterium lowii]
MAEGQIIGTLGGIPAQRHSADSGLHWGARILPTDDRYINPLSLLPTPIIRLKPVDGPARRPSANAENSRGYTPA